MCLSHVRTRYLSNLWHGAEFSRILENHLRTESVVKPKNVTFIYWWRTWSLGHIRVCLCVPDMCIHSIWPGRTDCSENCPWRHPCRVMPILSLALQNVALECSQTSPQIESLIKCKNTMHDVRPTAEHVPHLKGTPLTTCQGLIQCHFYSQNWQRCSAKSSQRQGFEIVWKTTQVHHNSYDNSTCFSNQSVFVFAYKRLCFSRCRIHI